MPQFWIAKSEVIKEFEADWTIAFKDVTAPTNVRTMIAAVVPAAGYGNTLPILSSDASDTEPALFKPLLLANLNSLALDYIARQKFRP